MHFHLHRSPVHPSVFATTSSNGTLHLWNLALSLEEPLTGSEGIQIEESGDALGKTSPQTTPTRSMNQLKWSLDGRRVILGYGDTLYVLGLTDEVWKTKGDDEIRMMSNLKARGLLDDD